MKLINIEYNFGNYVVCKAHQNWRPDRTVKLQPKPFVNIFGEVMQYEAYTKTHENCYISTGVALSSGFKTKAEAEQWAKKHYSDHSIVELFEHFICGV